MGVLKISRKLGERVFFRQRGVGGAVWGWMEVADGALTTDLAFFLSPEIEIIREELLDRERATANQSAGILDTLG